MLVGGNAVDRARLDLCGSAVSAESTNGTTPTGPRRWPRGSGWPSPRPPRAAPAPSLAVPDHVVAAARPECAEAPLHRHRRVRGHARARPASRRRERRRPLQPGSSMRWSAIPRRCSRGMRGSTPCAPRRPRPAWRCSLLALVCMRTWAAAVLALGRSPSAMTPVGLHHRLVGAQRPGDDGRAALWCALIGLWLRPDAIGPTACSSPSAAVAASVLVTVRSLGPAVGLLILVICLVASPIGCAAGAGSCDRRPAWPDAAVVCSADWRVFSGSLTQRSLVIGTRQSSADDLARRRAGPHGRSEVPLWLLQSIARVSLPRRGGSDASSTWSTPVLGIGSGRRRSARSADAAGSRSRWASLACSSCPVRDHARDRRQSTAPRGRDATGCRSRRSPAPWRRRPAARGARSRRASSSPALVLYVVGLVAGPVDGSPR